MSQVTRPTFQSDADTTLMASALLLIRSDLVTNDERDENEDATKVFAEGQLPSNVETMNLEPRPIAPASQGSNSLALGSGNRHTPRTSHVSRAHQNQPVLPAASLSSFGKISPSGQTQPTVVPTPSASTTFSRQRVLSDVDSIESVRREQVEAALRSKPQRGRKRNDLTDVERLELTRTRNREHAKSTRIRKKARYQELEGKEMQLEQLQAKQLLESERRQSIMDFFVVRGQQISGEHHVTEEGDSELMQQDTVIKLRGLVDDPAAFQFEDDLSSGTDTGFEGLARFDETLTRRVLDRFGRDTLRLLSYSASEDKIAISQSDSAFADVDLQLSGQQTVKLLSAIAKVRFASRTNKIVSVQWHTTQDDIDEVSLEPIGSQISYPSVVSFDPTTTGTTEPNLQGEAPSPLVEKKTASEPDAESGPGMNII